MKWYQYLTLFLLVASGIIVYILLKYKTQEDLKSKMLFTLRDSTYNDIFPDHFANLKSLKLYEYIRGEDTLIRIELCYVGTVYDYMIDLELRPYTISPYFQYFVTDQLINYRFYATYRSSFSVFYEKSFLSIKLSELHVVLIKKDSLFFAGGLILFEDQSFSVKVSFKADSVKMYKYSVL